MAAVVTKLNQAKRYRCSTPKFHHTLRWLKRRAHRLDRRKAKQSLKEGKEYYSVPRLTGWDII
jgi:hypothetical protein